MTKRVKAHNKMVKTKGGRKVKRIKEYKRK
jgi:hypothetical protein